MLAYIRNCVSGWGPLIGIPEVVRKNRFTLLQKLLWPGWAEMFSGPSWCLLEYVALYLSESQLVPAVKVTWSSWGVIRVFSLSTTWEAPICLLLFSSIPVSLWESSAAARWVAFSLVSPCFFLIVPCCWTLTKGSFQMHHLTFVICFLYLGCLA